MKSQSQIKKKQIQAKAKQNKTGAKNLEKYNASKSNKPTSLCEFTKTSKKEKQAEYHGNQYESGLPQKSAEVQKPIETREELAKSLPQKSAEPSKSIENETREKLAKGAEYQESVMQKSAEPISPATTRQYRFADFC